MAWNLRYFIDLPWNNILNICSSASSNLLTETPVLFIMQRVTLLQNVKHISGRTYLTVIGFVTSPFFFSGLAVCC